MCEIALDAPDNDDIVLQTPPYSYPTHRGSCVLRTASAPTAFHCSSVESQHVARSSLPMYKPFHCGKRIVTQHELALPSGPSSHQGRFPSLQHRCCMRRGRNVDIGCGNIWLTGDIAEPNGQAPRQPPRRCPRWRAYVSRMATTHPSGLSFL